MITVQLDKENLRVATDSSESHTCKTHKSKKSSVGKLWVKESRKLRLLKHPFLKLSSINGEKNFGVSHISKTII